MSFRYRAGNFFRRHYTGILLTVIAVSLMGSLFLLAVQSAKIDRNGQEGRQSIEGLIAELQHQHDHQDQRQECFFDLFIELVSSREPITDARVEECRLVREDTSEATTPTEAPQSAAPTVVAPSSAPSVRPEESVAASPPPDNPPPELPEPPPTSAVDRILQRVGDLVRGLL